MSPGFNGAEREDGVLPVEACGVGGNGLALHVTRRARRSTHHERPYALTNCRAGLRWGSRIRDPDASPIGPTPENAVSPSAASAGPSVQDLLDWARATQRQPTRTAFPVDAGVHEAAIAATGRLRDAILGVDVESATAALRCGTWADIEFASIFDGSVGDNDEVPLTHLTLLSLATLADCREHTVRMLSLLLEYGANLQQVDCSGRTLLHFADDTRVARWLLGHGVNPRSRGRRRRSEPYPSTACVRSHRSVATWAAIPGAGEWARPPNRL